MKQLISQTTGFFVPAATNSQPHEAFWQWFEANLAFLEGHESNTEAVVGELQGQLQSVNAHLTFEIGINETGQHQLILSADGVRAVFPDVIALYRCAPSLPQWQFVPFRPRVGTDHELHYDGYDMDASKLWYRTELRDGSPALYLYIDGLTEENSDALSGATYIMLDMALGEYDVETKVGQIELRPLTEDPRADGLKKFSHISQDIDAFYFKN